MQASVNISSDVIFSHPAIKTPLRITTGANEIAWSYVLNMIATPTLGGEVLQILSATVEEFTINGTTRSNEQLKQIVDWFKEYITVAGLGMRDQEPVTFQYPARGWSLKVWVKSTPQLHYATNLIGAPWQITAEVASDTDLNSLTQHTMSSKLTASIKPPWLLEVGFHGQTGANSLSLTDPNSQNGDTGGIDNIFQNIGRATASASGGNLGFLDKFDPTADPSSQFSKSISDLYKTLFGSDSLIPHTSGGTSLPLAGNTSTKDGIVQTIVSVFEGKGIPGRLGVAIALQESGSLDPEARQPNGDHAIGLFQTFPTGAGGSRSHASFLRQAFNDTSRPVTAHYTASMQIADAADWTAAAKNGNAALGIHPSPPFSIGDANDFDHCAQWAQAAQAAGVDYRTDTRFVQNWAKAKQLIEHAANHPAAATGARALVVQYANQCLGQNGQFTYTHGGRPISQHTEKGKMFATDCSGWVTALYGWATDWNNAYDPNGPANRYREGYTGSMFSASNGTTIDASKIQPGDLIIYGPSGVDHVNVYIGDGKMLGAGSIVNGIPFHYSFPDDNHFWPGPATIRSFLP